MLKKILIVLGILVGIVAIFLAFTKYYFKPNKELVLNFLKEHPNKMAIKLVRNDAVLASRNPNKIMPLASTVKILVTIEYAEQAANKLIDPDQAISLDELDKFYIPKTDGGAHPSWLKSVKDKIHNNTISIREIAKGMIAYSSNANTEWLCKKLGLKNINNRKDSLGITQHEDMYYIVSALFVGKEKFPNTKGEALERKLKDLSLEEYIETTNQVHTKLLLDLTYKNEIGELGLNIQKVWSDNLPGSTVEEYVGIMKKINSRTYFSSSTQKYLDEVMEVLLENPANRQWLEHAGMKGGSTAFVLTKALYASDKKGNKTELAYFLDNLGPLENARLQRSMNEFELKILTDEVFRRKVENELAN